MSSAFEHITDSDKNLLQCVLCQKTLISPVLLSCLHNACNECASDAMDSITCPVCHVSTNCKALASNYVVGALLSRSDILKSVHICTPCSQLGHTDSAAVAWCYDCQQSLCSECDCEHQKQTGQHDRCTVDEQTVLTDLYRLPTRLCTDHKKELSAACFTCRNAMCNRCVHSCYKSSHEVLPLEDPALPRRLEEEKSNLLRLLAVMDASSARIDSHIRLVDSLTSARLHDVRALQEEKKRAMDALNRAYENAERSLLQCYSTLEPKAMDLSTTAQTLKTHLRGSAEYCKMAFKSNDDLGLLLQLSTVNNCIQTLYGQATLMKDPTNPSKLVHKNVCVPTDVDRIASRWLGNPKLISDDLFISESELLLLAHLDRSSLQGETPREVKKQLQGQDDKEYLPRQHMESTTPDDNAMKRRDRSTLRNEEPGVAVADPRLLTQPQFFGAASATIRLPVNCCDVSSTDDGRLLLAAGTEGLLEYCTSGHELSRWLPPPQSSGQRSEVRSVVALNDGRAAVALRLERRVVLLRRAGVEQPGSVPQWIAEQHFDKLRQDPISLSAWGDTLAVAEWSFIVDVRLGMGFLDSEPEQGGWSGVELRRLSVHAQNIVNETPAPSANAVAKPASVSVGVYPSFEASQLLGTATPAFGTRALAFTFSSPAIHQSLVPVKPDVSQKSTAVGGLHPSKDCNSAPVSESDDKIAPTTRHQIYLLPREYKIHCIVLTEQLIVTTSCGEVRIDGGGRRSDRRAHVVDAHGRGDGDDDFRLWRVELGEYEQAWDVCSDASGRILYVVVARSDRSSGRVMAIDAENGRELQTDVISCDEGLLPLKISLAKAGRRSVLAVLCYDKNVNGQRAVVVHPNVEP